VKRINIFDVRTIIGLLLTIYGVILLLAATQTTEAEKARVNGTNANLWVGLALLVVGLLMLAWAVWRPLVVDEEQLEKDKREVDEEAHRRLDTSG
jgi:type VI protein secretion system component VasK